MKRSLLLCAVVGCAIAVPTGTYHQEYSYKSSSSSFKNNELQHKTDDQGYFKKDGDLEGRTRPRVDANSEHSEYVNPNLRVNGAYGDDTEMSSYGLMQAQRGVSSYGANQLVEGIASSDRIVGSRGYSGSSSYGVSNSGSSSYGSSKYGSGSYGSSGYGYGTYGTGTYGSSGYTGSYGSTASIQSIIQSIQQDFERNLQNNRWRETYSQAAIDQNELESQLKRNLTERLNSELLNRYGQQTIRNGMSYSILDGRTQSAANYDNQELANLKQQMENNLLNTLRTQYNRGYYGTSGGSSRYESHSQSQSNYGYSSSTIRPAYQTLYPSLPVYSTTQRTSYTTSSSSHSNYEIINSNVRYTPVINPESISIIASNVQTQLDSSLNRLLDDIYRKYFSSSTSYQLTNYDVVLNRLQNELKSNLTYLIEENLRRNYGSQIQRDGYLYSIGPNGQFSTNYNYALRDLEALKAQVERNLIEKLNREFSNYRTRYTSNSQSYSSQSNYNSYDQYSTTPRYYYTTYTTPRAHYSSGGLQDQYSYAGGSYGSGSSYSSGSYSGTSMSQLQRQLQDELSRQLQTAISKDYSSYSSSGSYSPQNYQSSLQHLTDELNRNVTRHLQEYSASASYSASGNYDQAQIENLRSQLLSSLTRQLQQNLQQHFQSSSSSAYSASGSSNYRPVRGFQNSLQGQYRSGGSVTIAGEDCDHGDMMGYRMKRSQYQPYRSRPLSYYPSYNANYGYSDPYRSSAAIPQQPSNGEIGQEVDNSEVTQQEELGREIEEVEFTPPQSFLSKPQKMQEASGQQIEDEFEQLYTGQQTQQIDEGQQAVEEEFDNLHIGQNEVGQQIDDTELTQQVEVEHPHISQNFEIPSSQHDIGQQVDVSKLAVAGEVYHQQGANVYEQLPAAQIQDASQQVQQYVEPLHKGLGTDDQQPDEFDYLQMGQQAETDFVGQVAEDSGILQGNQVVPVSYENSNQNIHNYDLSQQTEEFEPLQTGQQVDNSDVAYITSGNIPLTQNQQPGYTGIYMQNQQVTNSVGQGIQSSRNPESGYSIYSTANQFHPLTSQQVTDDMDNPGIYTKPNESDQQSGQPNTQQTEDFEPLQTGQQVDNTDVAYINSGNILLTQNQQNQQQGYTGIYTQNQQVTNNVGQGIQSSRNLQRGYSSYFTANHFHPLTSQEVTDDMGQPGIYNKPNEIDQQSGKSDTQQTEEFEPLQTGQQLENIDDPHVAPGNFQLTQNQQPGHSVQRYNNYPRRNSGNSVLNQYPQRENSNSFTRSQFSSNLSSTTNNGEFLPLSYWNSHQWKPNQERFISSTRKRLFSKLEEAFKNNQFSNYDTEKVLKELSANLTKEIGSYNENFLTQYLELTKDEIRGIKAIIFEDLRDHFDEKVRFVSQQDQNFGQGIISENSYTNEKPGVPSNTQIMNQVLENDTQKGEQDGIISALSTVSNVNKNYLESTISNPGKNFWSSSKWNEKQRRFIKQIESKLVNDLRGALEKNEYQNYGSEKITKELSQKIQNEFSYYSQYFLSNYLGFKKIDISEIQKNILNNLRTEYQEKTQKNNVNKLVGMSNLQIPEESYQSQQRVDNPSENINLEQQPENQRPTEEGHFASQNAVSLGRISQQDIEQFNDNSQLSENQFVEPLNYPNHYGLSNSGQTINNLRNNQKPIYSHYDRVERNHDSSHISSSYGSSFRKPTALPDSDSFINTEMTHQRNNAQYGSGMYFSPTLKKVIEEQAGAIPNFENNTPPNVVQNQFEEIDQQQSEDSLPSEGVGTIPLNKATVQQNTKMEVNSGYGSAPNLITANKQGTNYNNVDPSSLFAQHGDDFYEEKLNYGTQGVAQENIGYGSVPHPSTTNNQRTNYNLVDSSSLFAQNGDDFYEGKLHYGTQGVAQQNFETTGNLAHVDTARASEVLQSKPLQPSNTYSGVKGHRRIKLKNDAPGLTIPPSSTIFQSELVSEHQEETTIPTINQENLPWWKRFGNKISLGASNLKTKIIG